MSLRASPHLGTCVSQRKALCGSSPESVCSPRVARVQRSLGGSVGAPRTPARSRAPPSLRLLSCCPPVRFLQVGFRVFAVFKLVGCKPLSPLSVRAHVCPWEPVRPDLARPWRSVTRTAGDLRPAGSRGCAVLLTTVTPGGFHSGRRARGLASGIRLCSVQC